jgi:hypothetical protein
MPKSLSAATPGPVSPEEMAKLSIAIKRTGNTGVAAFINNQKVFDMSASVAGLHTQIAGGELVHTPFPAELDVGGSPILSPSGLSMRRPQANRYDITGGSTAKPSRALSAYSTPNGSTVFSFRKGQGGVDGWPDADLALSRNFFQKPDPSIGRFNSITLPFASTQGGGDGVKPPGVVTPMDIVCSEAWYFTQYYSMNCSCMVGQGTLRATCWSTGYAPINWQTTGYGGGGGNPPPSATVLGDCLYNALIAAGFFAVADLSEAAWMALTIGALAALAGIATTGVGLVAIIIAVIVAALVTIGLAFSDLTIFETLVVPCARKVGLPV